MLNMYLFVKKKTINIDNLGFFDKEIPKGLNVNP